MTSPVNIYEISRIRDTKAFNIVAGHQAQTGRTRTQYHEIESLRIVADAFMRAGLGVADCDGFFFGFSIPHIGKEFDLLKFTAERCLNIELKSQPIPKRQILAQLLKNRYYLMHLGKELSLFTVVTDTFSCYKLTADERLKEIDFSEIASVSRLFSTSYISSIDALFKASEYLTEHGKTYLCTMRLGITTDTEDMTGRELAHSDDIPDEAEVMGKIAER